jgi:hypothetical protein
MHRLISLIEGMRFSVLRNGTTPLVTIGAEVPLGSFRDQSNKSFFAGTSKSSHLASTVYNYLGSLEKGLNAIDTALTQRLARSNCLPFINLFNWPRRHINTVNDSMTFLTRYLELCRPVLVLTYGHLVMLIT